MGVVETKPGQTGSSDSNDFPQLSKAGIILNDDPELNKIFASVEVCSDLCNYTIHGKYLVGENFGELYR